jgi:WD40 repeat protein
MKRATFTDRTNEFVTISTYGEIIRHSVKDSQLLSETLLANAKYDFRDLYIKPDGTIYAVSYSGSLIIIRPNGRMEEHPLTTAIHPFRIFIPSDNALIIAAEQSILLYDDKQQKVVKTMPLQFSTKVAGNKDDEVVLFDQAGKMYLIDKTLSTITSQSLPFLQPVMSYIYQTNTGRAAYGTVDGTIYYFDSKGKMQKLVGHRSRVSRLKFYEDQLLSVSYDGTARFWDVASEKIEPITLLQSDQWIISSSYGSNRDYAWTGDANGNLTLTLIQPDLMAQNVQNSLKRDFTQEEWAYYIGSKIPYESFLSKRKGL